MHARTALLLTLLIATPLLAQTPAQTPLAAQTCIDTDTPQSCWQKFVAPIKVADMTNAVGAMVATTNTGTPELSNLTNSALRDFLSFFTAAYRTATVENDNGAVVVDYNLKLNLLDPNDVIKFQGKFSKPDLNAQLLTALGTNTGEISTLQDSLDEADDISVSATYSPASERWGRSLAEHRPLIEALIGGVAARRGPDEVTRKVAAFSDAVRLVPPNQLTDLNSPFTTITDAAIRAQVIASLTAAATAAKAQFADQEKVIASFADLLNNQEQFYVSGLYHDVNSLSGPDGWSVKATYELGGKNLSKFLKSSGGRCAANLLTNDTARMACLDAFNTYLGDDTMRGWRLSVAIDLDRTQANDIALPDLNIALHTSKANSHIGSLTAGRRLDPPSSSHERRIDITASYENVTGDATRDDRFVAAVTYTQELNDNMSFPVSFTYANQPKYLGAVDDKLGVHFGISYKLPDLTP
jgi:hypothetical protein